MSLRGTALLAGLILLGATACGSQPPPRPSPPVQSSGSASTPVTSAPSASPSLARELRGCVPECLTQAHSNFDATANEAFTTGSFMDGYFQITLPRGTWRTDDSTNEVMFEQTSAPDYIIAGWVDAYAVNNGKRVAGVASTPTALTKWILGNSNLTASAGPGARVGGAFPARTVDIALSRTAISDPAASDCPTVCYDYLGVPVLSSSPHGLARPGKARLYFSEIRYGGKEHLLTLAVEVNEGSLRSVLPAAEQALATIRIPAQAG